MFLGCRERVHWERMSEGLKKFHLQAHPLALLGRG